MVILLRHLRESIKRYISSELIKIAPILSEKYHEKIIK
jgi:hypothetical protein